ncbi:hypothetical protein B6S44_09955 [Bosea sp. Tri-44]|uniref:hypothetical protein n=1 Tax=Bosea sp. Tri-44 TaxID=1972137 RepID=UPI00100F8646|nr:hypothetical protein [Bosea sp. Tri-44]RXT55429.1 hypothetical protein B6S44_09955 [Bosea sp. Tri-44]
MMIRTAVLSFALALAAGPNVSAAPAFMPLPEAAPALPIEPARSALRKFFDALGDDDVHDDHYDWNDYRDTTSRKDRIRDYQRMQLDAQKDYWRQQKDMQKRAIKAQRGW